MEFSYQTLSQLYIELVAYKVKLSIKAEELQCLLIIV